jgi:transcriptional regulator with XRE-family HTH domain
MAGKSIVAKRLCEARTRAGVSQKKLGILAGIDEFSSSPRINQYERGKHTPDLRTVERIADVLEIPSAYFYAIENELAEWILAYSQTSPAARRRALKSLVKPRAEK